MAWRRSIVCWPNKEEFSSWLTDNNCSCQISEDLMASKKNVALISKYNSGLHYMLSRSNMQWLMWVSLVETHAVLSSKNLSSTINYHTHSFHSQIILRIVLNSFKLNSFYWAKYDSKGFFFIQQTSIERIKMDNI